MEYTLRQVNPDDKTAIIDIFNYYVENTFAAYPEQKVPCEFFGMLMQVSKGYPFYVAEADKKVLGYALLRPHVPFGTMRRSAELTCFVAPGYTGKGIGKALLERLKGDGKAMGIDTILASIASANEDSIKFHQKQGFKESGTFRRVGKKFGKDFDEVWMQLNI